MRRRAASGSIALELVCGQEEIAKELGTVREVVARSLWMLRDRGFIEQKRNPYGSSTRSDSGSSRARSVRSAPAARPEDQ